MKEEEIETQEGNKVIYPKYTIIIDHILWHRYLGVCAVDFKNSELII